MKSMRTRLVLNRMLVPGLILLAIAGRLIPHPDNFTPMVAVALFAGAMLPGWKAVTLVLIALAASDLLLGHPPGLSSLGIYAGFLFSVALGNGLRNRRTWPNTAACALIGSVIFFIISNFMIWALPDQHGYTDYAHSLVGLLDCYAMALAFLPNALIGDLLWTVLLFRLHDLGRIRLGTSLRQAVSSGT
jgi:hypothetical protein